MDAMRFTFSPFCGRCGIGVECWRAHCECWGPLARHAASREDAEMKGRRWVMHHVCGLSSFDRLDARRGEQRRELASAAHDAGLLF